jgi:hypothetical protein
MLSSLPPPRHMYMCVNTYIYMHIKTYIQRHTYLHFIFTAHFSKYYSNIMGEDTETLWVKIQRLSHFKSGRGVFHHSSIWFLYLCWLYVSVLLKWTFCQLFLYLRNLSEGKRILHFFSEGTCLLNVMQASLLEEVLWMNLLPKSTWGRSHEFY